MAMAPYIEHTAVRFLESFVFEHPARCLPEGGTFLGWRCGLKDAGRGERTAFICGAVDLEVCQWIGYPDLGSKFRQNGDIEKCL